MYIDTSTASFLYFFLYFWAAFTCGAVANQSFLSERNEMCPPNLYIWISCWCLVTHTQSYWIWWLKTLLGLNVFSFFFPFPCRFSLPVASDSLPWLFPLAFSQTPAPPTGPCKHSTHTHANRSTFNLSVHYTVAVYIYIFYAEFTVPALYALIPLLSHCSWTYMAAWLTCTGFLFAEVEDHKLE